MRKIFRLFSISQYSCPPNHSGHYSCCTIMNHLERYLLCASSRYRCSCLSQFPSPTSGSYTHIKAKLYSYSATKKLHLLPQIIYSCKTLYRFRFFRPSSGAQNCTYSNGICHPTAVAIAAGSSSCLTYTVAVCAVLSS